MYYLGLAFAEKMGNMYIYDMKASINTPHTTFKLGEVFHEEIKPLLVYRWNEVPTNISTPRMLQAIEYTPEKRLNWLGCTNCHRSLPFCGLDPTLEGEKIV